MWVESPVFAETLKLKPLTSVGLTQCLCSSWDRTPTLEEEGFLVSTVSVCGQPASSKAATAGRKFGVKSQIWSPRPPHHSTELPSSPGVLCHPLSGSILTITDTNITPSSHSSQAPAPPCCSQN